MQQKIQILGEKVENNDASGQLKAQKEFPVPVFFYICKHSLLQLSCKQILLYIYHRKWVHSTYRTLSVQNI